MRIVAGQARGRKLFAPKDDRIRPTADRVRQSLFDVLGPMHGLKVLDLFAGTGALGLEALSRGAVQALFVDASRDAIQLVTKNAAATGFERAATIWQSDAVRALGRMAEQNMTADLVFLDPPYHRFEVGKLFASDLLARILGAEARVILESDADTTVDLDKSWRILDSRRYGKTLVTLLIHAEP